MAGAGMAEEIGVFYVNVTPTVNKNVKDDLEKQLNKSTGSMTGMFAKATALGGKMFSKVGKIGLGAITTVATGLVGLAAKGGFDRALNIEQAQVKLKALGYNAGDVSNIMNSAMTSVKGTAFGLGDAASTAATLIAGGVKQGDELTNVLKTVADTAQISGRSFNDIGLIFSQVAAKGRLKGDDMLQLMSSGIPVLKLLADHFHTTTDDAQDMVTKGKVSFAEFAAAMQEGLGGAALSSGQSFKGSIANVKAALSRLGEKFETPMLTGLTKIFNALIPTIDNFNDAIAPVANVTGAKFTEWADKIVQILDKFNKGVKDGSINLQDIARSIATATAGFALLSQGDKIGAFATKLVPKIGKAQSGISSALEALNKGSVAKFDSVRQNFYSFFNKDLREAATVAGDPFASSLTKIEKGLTKINVPFKKAEGTVANSVKSLGTFLSDNVGSRLAAAGEAISYKTQGFQRIGGKAMVALQNGFESVQKGTIGKIASSLTSNMKTVTAGMGDVFGGLGGLIAPKLQGVTSLIGSFLSPSSIMMAIGIGGIIAALIAGLGMIDQSMNGQLEQIVQQFFTKLPVLLTDNVNNLTNNIPTWIMTGSNLLKTIFDGITQNAGIITDSAVEIINSLVTGLANQLPTLVPSALNMVVALAGGLIANLPQMINSGLQLLLGLAEGLMSALPQLIDKVPLIFSNLVDNIGAHLPEILSKGGQIIVTLGVGLINALPHIVSAMGSIMGKLIDVAKRTNWGDVGRNIIQGLIKGVQAMGNAFLDAIKKICADSLDAVKHFFGIKSPSRVMRDQVGKFIPLGMAVGIEQESDSVLDAMDSMMKIPSIVPSRYPELFTEFGAGKLNATMVNEWNTAQTGSKLDTLIGLQAAMYEDLGDIISQNVPSLSRRQAARI